jgi:cytochrome c-type protein NapC
MASSSKSGTTSRKKFVLILVLVFSAGILFTGLFNMGLSATNEMEFCTSCHSMKVNLEEYKETVHYQNTSGVRATCSDCHVPKEFGPKMVAKVLAYKDVLHEILGTIDTKEKYEAHRWDMASRVWAKMKATNSRECRSCHDFDQMDLSTQTRMARKRHSKAVDEDATCIDCHKGIAHTEPDEPEETVDKENKG